MTKTAEQPKLDEMLSYRIYALNLALGRFHQTAFNDTGFSYPKFVVLAALSESGPMNLADLADRVGVEPNSLSPVVKRMSAFGLIERVRDTKDERRVLLTLLPFGQNILIEAHEVLSAAWQDMELDPQEVAAASKVLTKLGLKLEDMAPTRLMRSPDTLKP